MVRYALSRLALALLTVILVSLIIFWLFQIVPGDPVLALIGDTADPALEAALREKFGLNVPPPARYLRWAIGVLRGDLGTSVRYSAPVSELLFEMLPNTLALSCMSLVITLIVGIPLGVLAAWFSRGARGTLFNILTQIGASIPSFFLTTLLMLFFALRLGAFKVVSYVPWGESPTECLKGLFLPSLAIAAASIATISRHTRTAVLIELSSDYVRSARGKGISGTRVLFAHVMRNAAIPIVTWLGVILTGILSGVIVIEAAFTIPGVGNLLYGGIKDRDMPLVQGISLYITVVVIVVFFVIDFLYRVIDPRIKNGNWNNDL